MSKIQFDYEVGAIYTDSPKMFYGFLDHLDVIEYGVSVASRAVSTVIDSNNAPVFPKKEIVCVPFENRKKAVRLYKELLKFIDITEVEKLRLEHALLERIKKNKISDMHLVYFNSLMLLLISKGKYAPLAISYLLLSLFYVVDFKQAYLILRALLTSEEDKWEMDVHLNEYGFINLLDEETKRNDAMLYVKVKDKNVHIH